MKDVNKLSSDMDRLVDFVGQLPSVKNVRVYTEEDVKYLSEHSPGDLTPLMRRQLIRIANE